MAGCIPVPVATVIPGGDKQ